MKQFFTFLSLTLAGYFIVFNFALAAELHYIPLVSLDLKNTTPTEISATTYISTFFTTFMAVIVALALFKVTSGGIKFMLSGDNSSARTEARKDIMQAIYGVVLALLTYMILYLINPRLIPGEDLFTNLNLKSDTTTQQ